MQSKEQTERPSDLKGILRLASLDGLAEIAQGMKEMARRLVEGIKHKFSGEFKEPIENGTAFKDLNGHKVSYQNTNEIYNLQDYNNQDSIEKSRQSVNGHTANVHHNDGR